MDNPLTARLVLVGIAAWAFASSASPAVCAAAASFAEDFDTDVTGEWTVNSGTGTNVADFFFDYGTAGIPPAPHSNGTTRGLKLQANLHGLPTDADLPGLSVSPAAQSFTGDYVVTFDWWHNYIGPLSGAPGSTMLSTFGVMTSGTVVNQAGAGDGVFFGATGDAGASADFRAFSVERPISYQLPHFLGNSNEFVDAHGQPIDAHATYHAGSRDASAALYAALFPAGATAPAGQQQPSDPFNPSPQTGSTPAGAAGFRWHEVTISKAGPLVTWAVNGTTLITVDTTDFVTPVGGSNILFGQSDVNNSASFDPGFPLYQFTLIDNVRVVPEPASATTALAATAAIAFARGRRRGRRA